MDITTEAVRVGLDLAQLRSEIASSNVANADMAGARIEHADFADALASLGDASRNADADSAQLAAITPDTLRADVHSSAAPSTGVTLDDQIAELNVQNVTYRALSEGLSRRFALMQLAISGK